MRRNPGLADREDMRSTAAATPGGTRPARVLLVDDHEISRAALSALLRTEGLEVADVEASDAAIAVAIIVCPSVAVIDVTPGNAAGFRIAERLRGLPSAPAVVLTSSAARRQFGSQLDGHRFIVKADLCASSIAGSS
jgi:CheY-like chemotaxis protein